MFTTPDDIRAAVDARRHPYPEPAVRGRPRTWIYAEGDYEAGLLRRLVQEGHAATNFAEFAANFRRPSSSVEVSEREPGRP